MLYLPRHYIPPTFSYSQIFNKIVIILILQSFIIAGNMKGDMLRYYYRNQIFLSQMGIWPYQSRMIKILLPSFLLLCEASTLPTQIRLLCNASNDMNMAVEGIVNLILLTGASTKLMNIAINNRKLQYLLELMHEHWQLFRSESELHILRYYANIAQKVTKYYSDVIIPLNESRPSIYVVAGDWGVDKEKYYYPIMLHSYLGIIISTRCMVNADTMYIACVLHGCSLFNAIGDRLENIFDKIKLAKNKIQMNKKHSIIKEYNSEDYHEMIACLKKHQLAIEFINFLDSAFRNAAFVILTLNVMILSLVGLQLISKFGQTQEVIRFACLVMGSITHLVSICLPGQLLLDRSLEVFDKAYNAQWYMFSLKTKRLLSILLHRCLVPCTLTAANMYIMSMTTFSSVMQTAMSYFTTFLSVS